MSNHYKNAQEYALEWCKVNGVKVSTKDNAKREQLPQLATIYLNRMAIKRT